MPSISDQLKELGVQVGAANIPKPVNQIPTNQLIDVLNGTWEETDHGDCFVVRKSLQFEHTQGFVTLSKDLDLSIFSTIPSFGNISEIKNEEIVYIDTETTGLSGGAGTYVFLIGVAKYTKTDIQFAQFFLQDPSKEASQLSALEDFVSSSNLIVSYNGKSFDLPRISTRYKYHRRQSPFNSFLHIDLLHIVRRLWKKHLPSCTLGDLEHHILGLKRSSLDIPGWQVSEKFFDYLSTGNPEPLKGVFYHNEIDVISLITLLSYISNRLSNPISSASRDLQDLISIGEYLNHIKQDTQAIPVIKKGLKNKDLTNEIRISGLLSLANIHKRSGEIELSVPLWEECAKLKDPRPHIELAKFYEHKNKDYQEAIHWTLSALEIYDSDPKDIQAAIFIKEAEHRLARLIRKSEK